MDGDSKEQVRDERREQIKKAALKVFAQRGLIGTRDEPDRQGSKN